MTVLSRIHGVSHNHKEACNYVVVYLVRFNVRLELSRSRDYDLTFTRCAGSRTKWYGQNGMDKMVYGQNGIRQNGMDKMIRTKWYG